MTDQSVLLAGLALLSLALPVGWAWWQKRQGETGINEQWLSSTARFIYGIGLPYLALIAGLLPPRFLGLKGLETIMALDLSGHGANLQKAVTLLLLECLADGGIVIRLGLAALLLALGLRWGLARLNLESLPSGWSIREIIYDGLHWAFYYAIFWALTGDLYLGVVGGMLWVLLEGALVAWAQRDTPASRLPLLIKTVILILTATIFFYAPNLWLLWPVHGGLAFIGTRRGSGPG
ncbi:MAG: hypothetical protein DPW09_41730 [Anaerolineae bacterium]|nr:hypothetical protein [Anaerolineales bacterium]MCQ3979983.1 hypothetical protein [Anaerolineae bacterium]